MREDEIGAVIGALDLDDLRHVVDIGGQAPGLAVALHRRFGAEIRLLALDDAGRVMPVPAGLRADYAARLAAAGIAPEVIGALEAGLPRERGSDVFLSINGFGTSRNVKGLKPFLDVHLHPGSRLVIDLRKGSGTYPLLNRYGSCNTLRAATKQEAGLVVLSPEPAPPPAEQWAGIARDLAGEKGFFTDLGDHSFLFVPRGDVLVVTFDNLDIAMTKREDRRPWGFGFIESQGWSMLGVMANGWTWFRDRAVEREFDRLRDEGFFARFRRVVFYGASMGGYGAAAFSAAAPGSVVFAISPQSTLDKSVVPWEQRYRKAWGRDFSGTYGDAAAASRAAREVHLMYDPHVAPDAAHAARFTGENVIRWRCPLLGHRLGSSLHQMGVLQEIARRAIEGELERPAFYRLLRRRRSFPRYLRELANLALDRGRPGLARRVCLHALRLQPEDRHFTSLLERLDGGSVADGRSGADGPGERRNG